MRRGIRLLSATAVFTLMTACGATPPQDIPAIASPVSAESDPQRPPRLFLQQVSSDTAIVKWRGDAEQSCLAQSTEDLKLGKSCVTARVTESNHKEALFTGLVADTQYYYSVGPYSDKSLRFRTAPQTGKLPADNNIHIWIIGDSGTATEQYVPGVFTHPGEAKAVMDGYLDYNARQSNEALDLFLLLGDNAYVAGTDDQWQGAVFDLYTELLGQAATWPTIGNHEMGMGAIEHPVKGKLYYPGASTSTDPNAYIGKDSKHIGRMPYLDIFTLPTKGEVGGVPSGNEQYYSFNYGNVHIVSLDSQLTARDEQQRAVMKQWLISDLSSNNQDWTVVIFHHPPYTKGSHDSDTAPSRYLGIDDPIVDMRLEFTPVFEDYGVDLVYGGHSHAYERSFYLHGHTGDADSFVAEKHTELNAAGKPARGNGDESYPQISANSRKDDKVVYTVAGSSGKVSLGKGKLDHPAHIVQKADPQQRRGLAELGSVVLDAGATELTARFINDKGQVLDTVTIQR